MRKKASIHERAGMLRDSVFAANDGTITTFAIIAGSEGAGFPSNIVVILGLVNLLADGISMASSSYLGVKSEIEFEKAEGSHDSDGESPLKHGVVTFVTFSFIGFLPLIPYIISIPSQFAISGLIVGLSLFSIGASRGSLTKKSWFKSGLEMLIVGGVATVVAYLVGFLAHKYLLT